MKSESSVSQLMPEQWYSVAQLSAGLPLEQRNPEGLSPFFRSCVSQVVDWLFNVISQPASQLDRAGAICPFVPAALDKDLVFITIADIDDYNETTIAAYLDRIRPVFLTMPPVMPDKEAIYKSLIVVFPSVPESNPDLLKRVRQVVKPHFLQDMLTCGEFYPTNDDRSVRNDTFLIARAPVPLLAIRYLTPHDELFLHSQEDLYPIFLKHVKEL